MASPSVSRSPYRSDRRFLSSAGGGDGTPPGKKLPGTRLASTAALRASTEDDDADSGRVRVAVRIRPKTDEDISYDSEFIDCLEIQPELRRLKLRKNNWTTEYYKFDEVFAESASQKRVYEAVAKPVVESVLDGYNGTVMAYGQTGTGKTFTICQLGKETSSERGIMVRAMEDILACTSPGHDTVSVSYLQLYLESLQDLLAPDKTNISLTEDTKSGEVCLPSATVVEIRDINQFIGLLQNGEANRHAANTKVNVRSSRSHAILVVHIQRSSKGKEENEFLSVDMTNVEESADQRPVLLKSKLLIIDLAGSERIEKSGVDGRMLEEAKFINLSLTSLGKCINALAENSPHIPTRESKLTRLLSDSFGGTAKTSLVITVGPSARHYSETSSTIMFGQRAMKVVNMLKLKEEYDYVSECRKLECKVDNLTSEMEKHQKAILQLESRLYDREMTLAEAEKRLVEAQNKVAEAEKKPTTISEDQIEDSTYQWAPASSEKKVSELIIKLEEERSRHANLEGKLIVILEYQDTKLAEATSKINLLADLINHQAAAARVNPRAEVTAIWFAVILLTFSSLYIPF